MSCRNFSRMIACKLLGADFFAAFIAPPPTGAAATTPDPEAPGLATTTADSLASAAGIANKANTDSSSGNVASDGRRVAAFQNNNEA